MGTLDMSALAEERVGLVKKQYRVVVAHLLEDHVQIFFGLTNLF